MPTYRLHDTTGDDLGLIEHPAPNVELGDVVVFPDGREALVTARVEPGPLTALLESGYRADAADERRLHRLADLASYLRIEEWGLEVGRRLRRD